MDAERIREQARREAAACLREQNDYRLGYLDAEQSHPLTRDMSGVFERSAEEGVRLLCRVDQQIARESVRVLQGAGYADFAATVAHTIASGRRIVFSGCGSSGRLCMRLERSWRDAALRLAREDPTHAGEWERTARQVLGLMTGGEYTLIRAVESFEDYISLGQAQAKEFALGEGDLLVGVTATGETASILGTAIQALEDGAQAYMLVCSDPEPVRARTERGRRVYSHPRTRFLYLHCGPMALTGSTRMQSSTFEQAVSGFALQQALNAEKHKRGLAGEDMDYAAAFVRMADSVAAPAAVSLLARCIRQEEQCFRQRGLVTIFADEFMLDVLTDTTELPPTFLLPPYRAKGEEAHDAPWVFAKNPLAPTREAWRRCFGREPRCLAWPREKYIALGVPEAAVRKIPDIDLEAMQYFAIGCEPNPERENAPASMALWVGRGDAPAAFDRQARAYAQCGALTLEKAALDIAPTGLCIFEHLAMKLLLNNLSTGAMARLGRISGNYMTHLNMSNKKLVDRSARIIADLCAVPYEEALTELFVSWLATRDDPAANLSPAHAAIQRLKNR